MEVLIVIIIALALLGYGLVSGRLQTTIITAPMVFLVFGMLLGEKALGLVGFELKEEFVHHLVELTLVFVLFSDASRIDLKLLRRQYRIPQRMLSIGLPLTIIGGAAVAAVMFNFLTIWEAALLAAILAPTDAALGQAVVSNPQVPVRIRQSLNVESGLNDGIALPLVLVFLSLADSQMMSQSIEYWLGFAAQQIFVGTAMGIAIGWLGGKCIYAAWKKGWIQEHFRGLATMGLALLAWAGAEYLGGNGFIAAFVAGLTVGNATRELCNSLVSFIEAEGQLLVLFTFMAFGAVLVWPAFDHFDPMMLIYAILSLTVIRMIPVALSLIGLKLLPWTYAFLGWFGPRGVASILFGLMALDAEHIVQREAIFQIVMITVFFSVFAHGMTAYPFSKWYSRHVHRIKDDEHEEAKASDEMPVRLTYHGPNHF